MGVRSKNKITVKEIKEIEPKADIYELSKHCRYFITVKKSLLVGGNDTAMSKAKIIMQMMSQLDIPCAIMIGVDEDVKFMELTNGN